ncbi:hypothetical protein AX14_014346 [Amanita brunnescens Koide BX004]|nr:hypothetical protein AX14_014346 [Amanita brunnescens Koide BX004]
MSDREGHSGAPPTDDDLSLPKATVAKMISELLPNDVICAKETRDLVIECCVEFIHLISSEANEICEQESKKTIAPEHIIGALKRLGFDSFTSEVEDVLKDHKQQQKVCARAPISAAHKRAKLSCVLRTGRRKCPSWNSLG